MNGDLLDRMIARARGEAQALRPVIAPAVIGRLDEQPAVIHVDPEGDVDPSGPSTAKRTRPPTASPVSLATPPPDQPSVVPTASVPPRTASATPAPPRVGSVTPATGRVLPVLPVVPLPANRPDDSAAAAAPAASVVTPPEPDALRPMATVGGPTRDPDPAPARTALIAAPFTPVEPELQREPAMPVPVRHRPAAAGPIGPDRVGAEPDPPIVRLTVGRLEVRVSAPAAPVGGQPGGGQPGGGQPGGGQPGPAKDRRLAEAPVRRSRPALSLGEYVRRREARQR